MNQIQKEQTHQKLPFSRGISSHGAALQSERTPEPKIHRAKHPDAWKCIEGWMTFCGPSFHSRRDTRANLMIRHVIWQQYMIYYITQHQGNPWLFHRNTHAFRLDESFQSRRRVEFIDIFRSPAMSLTYLPFMSVKVHFLDSLWCVEKEHLNKSVKSPCLQI